MRSNHVEPRRRGERRVPVFVKDLLAMLGYVLKLLNRAIRYKLRILDLSEVGFGIR
jgi:hypothetical protein